MTRLLISWSPRVTVAGGATKNVGRGTMYETALIKDNAGIGMYVFLKGAQI